MKILVWLFIFVALVAGVAGCGKPTKKVQVHVTTPQSVAPNAKTGDVKLNPNDGAEMVWVPAGEFLMGSTDKDIAVLLHKYPDMKPIKEIFNSQKPQRKVYLYGYWIYKTEVTVAQFRKFCSETGRAMPPEPDWGWNVEHPVVNVTWQDAAEYAKWAGVSLPTEAQWEKAARGTDGRRYPWGDSWDVSKCVNISNANSCTQPVGSKPAGASPCGCMDMAGNVWEWCADWYSDDYYKSAPARNPMGPSSGEYRVLRGGSWGGDGSLFQCARRYDYAPGHRDYGFGFRCARTP